MSEEMMDHVNEHDEVVGTFPRSEIYSRKLRHRIAHVFLLDAQGRIALARRGKEISYCPDHWCSTAAGHVAAGESYEDAALREMQEEIGVTVPLTFVGVTPFVKPGTSHDKLLGVYTAQYEGLFVCDPHEVQYVEYRSVEEIRAMLLNEQELVHPETRALLQKYFL
ncbi:MAG: NUDIX domain-containing protein [Patescibacteria group bacterium]